MATVISEPEIPVEKESTPSPETSSEISMADASMLENRMPEWFRAPRVLPGFILVLGLVYFFFSFRPLWHTDVWGHMSYGRMICETGSIPEFEPFMPLAEGVPLVDSAWLSQVIGYGAFVMLGVTAIQFLYAASVTCCLSLFCWRSYRRSHSFLLTILGCGLLLWVEWQPFMVPRPQLVGVVLFIGLFALLTSRNWHRANWFVIPLMFAAWANLHGSFPVGLGLLGAFCLGRMIDVVHRCKGFSIGKRLRAMSRDTWVRRYFLLLELAAASALLNPYGWRLFPEVFQFSTHPNLELILDWEPLTLRMKQGQAAAIVGLMLVFLYRFTPRRVSAVEPILLVTLGAAMLWTSRMLVWWGPVAVYYCVLHGSAICRRRFGKGDEVSPSPSSSLWAVASLGMIWIVFAYTPFGLRLIHGIEPEPSRSYSGHTPLGAAQFLYDHAPTGQVFNTSELGDYLVWAGPDKLQVFVTSHVHLVPEEVWQHYLQIIQVESGWEDLLDRYGVNTIVLNTGIHPELVARLRKESGWKVTYEDERSIIFQRRRSI
ncbi:MAG: hypothetical protein Tsb009_29060 [Planctomycetaceae bacterium]